MTQQSKSHYLLKMVIEVAENGLIKETSPCFFNYSLLGEKQKEENVWHTNDEKKTVLFIHRLAKF